MPPAEPTQRTELDLFVVALLLRRHLFRIALFAAAGFVLMMIAALTTKPTFSSTAVLIVPRNNPSAASLALQAATGGLDLMGGGYEIYTDILRSRTIADKLIEKHQLKAAYGTSDLATAERMLAVKTTLLAAKEGLVRVTVADTDPKRAADLANDYLDELDHLNQNLAITSAGQQRLYFERQLIKEKGRTRRCRG